MPTIEEKDLLNLHKKIDLNKDIANEWKQRFDEKENENIALKNKKNWILIALIFLGVFCLFLFYTARVKPFWLTNNEILVKSGYKIVNLNEVQNIPNTTKNKEVIIDSISNAPYNGIIYQIQIGAFKKFSVKLQSDDFSNLSEYSVDDYNKYAVGKFSSYADAITSKKNLKKIGFKDTFIISFYKNKPIDIKKALKLSNEPQYLGEK